MTPLEFRDAWRTPPGVFNWLDDRFNFDVDLCADKTNALVSIYMDKDFDALTDSWHLYGDTGFCNPPYSQQKDFVNAAVQEAGLGFTTVMLLPVFNGQSFWEQIFDNATVFPIIGRLSFLAPCDFEQRVKVKGEEVIKQIKENDPLQGNTSGSRIVVFGDATPLAGYEYLLRDEMK